MGHSSGVQVLAMTRDAFDLADQRAAHEGWIPGLTDARCFYATESYGLLIGFVGEVQFGCISVVINPIRQTFTRQVSKVVHAGAIVQQSRSIICTPLAWLRTLPAVSI